MTTGTLVVLERLIGPDSWDLFMAEKPAGWEVKVVNPADGEEKVAKQLEDAEYLLTSSASLKILEGAKKLKLIQAVGVGTERLPRKWAMEKGIFIANTGSANAISVAEYTVLLMLACLRKLLPSHQAFLEGKFRRDTKTSHEIYDKTVGVAGFGNIGRRVAKLCFGFGANIIYYDPIVMPYALRADLKARPVSMDDLLSTSDIISLHVQSTESTRKMMGYDQFCKMKPSAYVINTSRGDLIDEAGLIRALNEKKIAGAGLDVFDPEPPDPKNPLLHMPNVVATPHDAGWAWENWKPRFETIWMNVVRVSQGKEPMNRVREI